MRAIMLNLGRGAAVLLGAAVATTSFGEPVKPAVLAPPREQPARPAVTETDRAHRLEVYEGPNRTVYYFGGGASSSERATLAELQRAENEMDYLNNLQALRRQYVNSERILEPQRRYVQEQLYGTQISYSLGNFMGGGGWGYGYGGGYGGGLLNYGYAYPFGAYASPYGGFGAYGGYGGVGGGNPTQVVRSLQFGMGDEGRLKDAMAPVIAQQAASPEYAASVIKNYNTALADAARSDRIAKDLGLKKSDIGEVGPKGSPDQPLKPAPYVLTLKNGDKVQGASMKPDGDWYVVESQSKTTRVLKSQVVQIEENK